MEETIKYVTVFVAGAAGLWKGIPIGFAFGFSPFITASLTSLGSFSSILLIYFSGDPFRKKIMNRYENKGFGRKKEKFSNWLDKYGMVGLGLISTGLLGPIITVLTGLVVLNDIKKFVLIMIIGVLVWTFGVTYLSAPITEFIKGLFS